MEAFAVSQSVVSALPATSSSYALRGALVPRAQEAGFSTAKSVVGMAALSVAVASVLKADRRKALRAQKVCVKARGGDAVETFPTIEINYYSLDEIHAPKIIASMQSALKAMRGKFSTDQSAEAQLSAALCDSDVMSALVSISRLPVLSHEFGIVFKDDLELLNTLKQIKYFWNLPQSLLLLLTGLVLRHMLFDFMKLIP